jgi:hypothetical protein
MYLREFTGIKNVNDSNSQVIVRWLTFRSVGEKFSELLPAGVIPIGELRVNLEGSHHYYFEEEVFLSLPHLRQARKLLVKEGSRALRRIVVPADIEPREISQSISQQMDSFSCWGSTPEGKSCLYVTSANEVGACLIAYNEGLRATETADERWTWQLLGLHETRMAFS